MTTQWDHRTAAVNGINIHYVTQGTGEPVIMLHGWPEFWYGWRRQIPVLAESYQVIVPDLRGFGYSDKPLTGYDTRTSASDIYELMRALGHEQTLMVAHDIGARVAFRFALDHEDAVKKLALLDSTPPTELLGPQNPAVIRERWHVYFHQQFDLPEKLLEGKEEVYLWHILKDWSTSQYPVNEEELALYVKAYSQPGGWRGGFNYYRAMADEDPPQWRADAETPTGHAFPILVRQQKSQNRGSHGRHRPGRSLEAELPSGTGSRTWGTTAILSSGRRLT